MVRFRSWTIPTNSISIPTKRGEESSIDVTQIATKEITVAHSFGELRLGPDEYTITLYLHGKILIRYLNTSSFSHLFCWQIMICCKTVYLSMAIPVIVKVETKTKSPGIIPESWHINLILGPIHVLYNVWTKVTGDITVQSSKSLIAKLTIKMLLTWKMDSKINSYYLIN